MSAPTPQAPQSPKQEPAAPPIPSAVFSQYQQFIVPPAALPGGASPAFTAAQSPFFGPTGISPGLSPTDPAFAMYMQQLQAQAYMQAQMQSYYQQMMMAQQQASFGTPSLTPTGSPALGPASDSTGLRRRKSHREKPDRVPADGEQAAPPPQAEAKVDDEPALTPEAAEAARAQAAVVRRRQENAQAVVQLTMFVLFLLFMGSGRDSSPSAWIPYIVLFALILLKIVQMCRVKREAPAAVVNPDDALLSRPSYSLAQPPAGTLFDVFAAVLHFFLSINPSWEAPAPPSNDAAELEQLLNPPLPPAPAVPEPIEPIAPAQ